jgi:hypothetical protein
MGGTPGVSAGGGSWGAHGMDILPRSIRIPIRIRHRSSCRRPLQRLHRLRLYPTCSPQAQPGSGTIVHNPRGIILTSPYALVAGKLCPRRLRRVPCRQRLRHTGICRESSGPTRDTAWLSGPQRWERRKGKTARTMRRSTALLCCGLPGVARSVPVTLWFEMISVTPQTPWWYGTTRQHDHTGVAPSIVPRCLKFFAGQTLLCLTWTCILRRGGGRWTSTGREDVLSCLCCSW